MTWQIAPTHDSLAAKAYRLMHPGYSFCGRCGLPWPVVDKRGGAHTTWYEIRSGGGRRGCFPLCESCWDLLGHPEARVEYYVALVDEWDRQGHRPDDDVVHSIMMAVANEPVTRSWEETA